jgi:hypothetical protein
MMKLLVWITKRIGGSLIAVWFFVVLAQSTLSAQSINDFFDGTVLQEIRLEINPKDWATLKANPASNTYYPCNLKWHGLVIENIGIRQRGGSTRNTIKPGLRIDFNRYEAGQTFLGLKSVGLDNMGQDASMMKERLSMELFSKMGLPATREVNVRLYVNDEYSGLYTILESVDKDFLQRIFGENDGFLYEYVLAGNYHFEYLGADPALYSPKYFDPKTHEKDPDPAPIEAMIRTMNTASDADFASAMAPYLDLELFMKHLAVEDFIAEIDGILTGMNNFNLYRFENKNLSQFIVKDKDLTFGGTFNKVNRYSTSLLFNASKNVLIRRAMNVKKARDAYFNTLAYTAAVAGRSGGWLESEITRIYNQIRTAAYEDQRKICYDGNAQNLCTNAAFEAEVASNLEFARKRSDFVLSQIVELSGERFYTISNLGGYSLSRADTARPLYAGYAMVHQDVASPSPQGIAIFTYRQNGMVVTEAGVPATAALQHGMVYAEKNGPVKTGLAIANPGDTAASISFFYTDSEGKTSGQGSIVIPAGVQIARFLDEAPFNSSSPARATLTFDSSAPVYVTALRGVTNERSEFIVSTLPVIDAAATPGTVILPHFADGGGWTTQVILVNPSGQTMQGTIDLLDEGAPASSPYSIAAGSYFRFQTSGSGANIRAGSVRIVPAANGTAPAAFAVFSFRKDGVTVTEASVLAARGATAYRAYVETSDNIQTGIAIANPSSAPITVNLAATTLLGEQAGLSGTLSIPANGHVSAFLGQISGFERMTSPFQGILRVSTTASTGIVVAGLRGRTNERGDFLIATLPTVDEATPSPKSELAIPHFAEGNGYSTQFILISPASTPSLTGVLRLFDQTGYPINAW